MSIDRLLHVVYLRLRSLFRRNDVERDLDDELQDHLARQVEQNIARGMPPDEARSAALRALGGVEFRKEQVRDARGTRWIEDLLGDVRFAVRSLRRTPAFSVTIVLTLALGIGANTAMFTLLRGTLLKPLPNRHGESLVYLRQAAEGLGRRDLSFSIPEVEEYRAGTKTLASIAEYSNVLPFTLVGADGIAVRVRAAVVSGNFFDVIGLGPVIGRVTGSGDDGASASPVAVLSHAYWMQHFGGDPAIVGRTLRLNEKVTTVIGVVEPAPQYPDPIDVYVNTVTSPHHLSATMVTERTHRMTEIFARLAPDATLDQVRAEVGGIAAAMFHDHPEAYEQAAQYAVTVSPLRDAENERAATTFWLLMGAAVFVLLIAGANVSNLTLMRGVGREREMLVRAALGAGRSRLRRLLLAENLVLALLGGAVGVLVAIAGLGLLVAFAAQFTPRADEIHVDGVVLAVGLATSVAVAIALAFIPRIGGERALAASLAPTGRRTTLGRGRHRLQRALVVTQIAVCMVLLTGAGLLVRTLVNLQAVVTGVHVEHVLTLELPLGGDLLRTVMNQPANLANYERMRERVAALPGVDVASLGSVAPLRSSIMAFDVKAEDRPSPADRPTPHAAFKTVDPLYFNATGISLLAGRGFESTDRRESARVVVLSQSFARQLFGDDNPIGQRVALTGKVLQFTPFTDAWRTVVGVVADTRDGGLDRDVTPALYAPFAQDFIVSGALVVRTAADPAGLRQTIMRVVHEVAPSQLIERVATLAQIRDDSVVTRRLNAMFIAAFGALALVIATVGIAGVLAFSVSSRTAEIGIRMSLGAGAARVHRMILGEGGVLLVAGLAVGFAGALAAAQLLRSLLFGVSPHDPVTLGGVAFILAAVGVAACWLPAARAARVDPAIALRAD